AAEELRSRHYPAQEHSAGKCYTLALPPSSLSLTIFFKILMLLMLAPKLTLAQPTSTNVDRLLSDAAEQEKKQDYAGAEKTYRQALSIAPDSPEIRKRLGILYQTELKFPDSIRLFEQILAAAPQYSAVNFYLGVSFLGENEFEKASQSFRRELLAPH